MSEKPGFAAAAGAVADLRTAVRQGDVVLDPASAEALVAGVDDAAARVGELRAIAAQDLAVPLDFGNNWVGRLVSDRIAAAASGPEESAATVLAQFADILAELAKTLREASGLTTSTDQAAGASVSRAGEIS